MAAIIAPIVARDEAETVLIKSANRTIQVSLHSTPNPKPVTSLLVTYVGVTQNCHQHNAVTKIEFPLKIRSKI